VHAHLHPTPVSQTGSTRAKLTVDPISQVIKALYDYKANNPDQLSFSQGDFLHVVNRENDPDWYEACNPLHGSRGRTLRA
jgi:hypothetical protein